jgi:hypothetical protein
VLAKLVRLRREPDEEAAALPGAELPENVRGWGEVERQAILLGGHLLGRDAAWPVVGDRRRLDHDRRDLGGMEHRLAHLEGGLDRDHPNPARQREMGWSGDERHRGAAPHRLGGDRVSHAAGRAIAQIANGVEPLSRGPGRHQDMVAREVPAGPQETNRRLDDVRDLGEPPLAVEAGRELPVTGLQHGGPPGAERRHVGLDRGMLPHATVHGRPEEHRPAHREEERPQEVIGEPEGRTRQGVRGGGGDQEQVGALGERHVLHRGRLLRVEQVREDRSTGQRPEGEWRHELARVGRHHDGDARLRAP